MSDIVTLSLSDCEEQLRYIELLSAWNNDRYTEYGQRRKACVRTFGCQMNEHDTEKISGLLVRLGYELTEDYATGNDLTSAPMCDLVLFNTCCIRENAEEKVYGHLGALKGVKTIKPDMITVVCGCMTEQAHVIADIKKKYRNVDIVFGTHDIHRLPELIYKAVFDNVHIYEKPKSISDIVEKLPIKRESCIKAWVTIMYGCNNFCTYCIVPYVRGRERSREAENILDEIRELDDKGYREITLLGQNVNSYSSTDTFPMLLRHICDNLKNIKRVRFMTSHPKDISEELIQAIHDLPCVCKSLHLPAQSGSSSILKRMNRHYTKEKYLDIVKRVREVNPGISLTTDIIVGFPGETEEDFEETLELMRTVRFDMAFTFIYSKREGTLAASYEDQVPDDVVKDRFERLLAVQNQISFEINKELEGKQVSVLVEGLSKSDPSKYTGRTESNKIVNFTYDNGAGDIIGQIVGVNVSRVQTWYLEGSFTCLE